MALIKNLPTTIKNVLNDIYDNAMNASDYNYVEYAEDGGVRYKIHAKATIIGGEAKSMTIRIVPKGV
jgi:hypothetical protein